MDRTNETSMGADGEGGGEAGEGADDSCQEGEIKGEERTEGGFRV